MKTSPLAVLVVQGSILDVDVQAIVNPANSLGIMGGGVAGVIRRAAGAEVEHEAVQQAPIFVGQAILTSGGQTRFQHIIHAPTMSAPAMRIPPENVALATRAALALADKTGLSSLAIPGMGTGVGGVPAKAAAEAMMHEIRSCSPRSLKKVVLVDIDPAMVQAWQDLAA